MTENNARLDKVRLLLIENNKNSFLLDADNDIQYIRKTDFTKNILHYLIRDIDIDKIFFSKKKNKNVMIKPKKLLKVIIKKLPRSRAAHPYIFFLFHSELKEYGLEFKYFKDVDTFEIRSKTLHIREQIQESFKIVERILSDNTLEILSPDLFNYCFKENGIKIEERVVTGLNRVNYRMIDMTMQISKKSKVYLEINEHHHDKELDLERTVEIYIKHNTHPVMIYKEEEDFEEIIKNVWREIAFGLFEENCQDALVIYLNKVDNFDLSLSKFFVEIQTNLIEKNKAIPIKNIKKFLSKQEFKHFYKFVKKMIESDDLNDKEHFVKLDLDNIQDSSLNKHGYDTLLMLPRKDDWYRSKELKKCFSDFKSNYLVLVKKLMSSQYDRISVLREACVNYRSLSILTDSTFMCLQNLIAKNSDLIYQKLGIKLHSKVWCFKYYKGGRIPFYELEKIFNKNVIDYIKLNNETKKNILNYQLLDDQELESIVDLINSDSIVLKEESQQINLEEDAFAF